MDVVVRFRAPVRMQMPVAEAVVLMPVAVETKRADERRDPDRDQRQADSPLHHWRHPCGEPPAGQHESATDDEDDQRVADPPACADREGTPPLGAAAHEDADRGQVIGRERVRGSEEQGGGEEAAHAGSNSSATSIDGAECVSAPTEIQSTPAIAIARTDSRVTPPDAST